MTGAQELAKTRREAIIALRAEHPDMPLAEIGRRTGVTGARAHQVLAQAMMRTGHPIWGCAQCGKGQTNTKRSERYTELCGACASARSKTEKTVMDCCDHCGTRMTWRARAQVHRKQLGKPVMHHYCSTECRDEANVERWRAMGLANKGKHRLDLRKAVCKRGHPRTPENVYAHGECIQCKREHKPRQLPQADRTPTSSSRRLTCMKRAKYHETVSTPL